MELTDLFLSQIADPFRIALTVGLVLTAARTGAVTGWIIPLAAGVLFIAVLIPTTLKADEAPFWPAVGVGLVSTTVILAAVMAVWAAVLRFRRR